MLTKRLKQLREEAGLLQKDVAEKLYLIKATYNNYERGVRSPDMDTLKSIADFYKVSIDYLLGRTDKREMYHISEELVIINNLKKIIKTFGVNKFTDILKDSTVTPDMITAYLNSDKKPPISSLYVISKILDFNYSYFYKINNCKSMDEIKKAFPLDENNNLELLNVLEKASKYNISYTDVGRVIDNIIHIKKKE